MVNISLWMAESQLRGKWMIQKGKIEKVIDRYNYKVRIPKYDKVQEDSEGTSTEDLATGIVCTTPGMNVAYTIGDVVIVSFENDEINKPVILGLLYRDNNRNIDSDSSLTGVDENIKELESSIDGIKNSSSVYTHIRYSNDNGVSFTSLYNPNIAERTDSSGNIYCIPVWSKRGINGIEIDKSSKFLTWFISDENNHDITNQIGIETIFLDSAGNILRTIPKEEKNYTIQLNNLTETEDKLYLTYKIYVPKSYIDTLHVSLGSDKNVLGTIEGKYLGICVSNSSVAPLQLSSYKWISFAAGGMSNDVLEVISELEETTGEIKEQMTEVTTDVNGFRVSVAEAVTTSQRAEDTAQSVRDAADRGDFDGVGVYSTEITYQESSSNTEVPSGTWYDEEHMPEVPDGHYLWTKTYITYTNNTHSTSYSVAKQGVKGDTGDSGLSTSFVLLYQRGSTAPTKPTGNLIYTFATGNITTDPSDVTSNLNGWTKNIPAVNGQPCWVISATASANTLTDIIEDTDWSSQVKFVEDGESGGIGAHGINTAPVYLYQRSSTTPSKPTNTLTYTFSTKQISGTIDNNWVTDIGSLTGDNPIWIIGAVASSNTDTDTIGSNGWSTPIIMSQDGQDGNDGNDGQDGVSISSVTNYYLATSASSGVTPSTSGWTDTIQSMDSTNQYLWNYEVITGSDSSTISTTTPVIIGRYGQDGSQGPSGSDGKGITSITEYYLATSASSDVTPSTSGWTTEVQTTDSTNKYLWNYEVIAYTVGSPYISEPRIIGTQGEDGQDGTDGVDGLNQATIYIYKRSITVPSDPEESGTYTFATGELTGNIIDEEGWETSVPTGSNPCYVSTGIAIGRGATATISNWSEVVKFVENGTNGIDGYNQATLNLYQRTTSTLTGSDVPTNTSYNFSTKQITGSLGSWATSIPSGENPCWCTSAVAISRESTVSLTWSTPVKLVQDGQSGLNQATINLYKRYTPTTQKPIPSKPSISVKYKFSDGTLRNNNQIITTLQDWYRNIPSGAEQCWIISASAIAREDEVTILSSSWSNPTAIVKDGASATQYYTYVKYATDSSGSNMRDTPMAGYNYIGTYTGTTQTPSANLYTWSKYVGDNGQDGTSVTVQNIEYAVTDTEEEPSNWESIIPPVGEGQWLWSKVTLSGENNTIISKSYSGISGDDGYNQATINLYNRSSSIPQASMPSVNVYYRFSDGLFSTNGGSSWADTLTTGSGSNSRTWTKNIPAVDTDHPEYPCWVISAVSISQDSTDDISTSEWSGPNKCSENGLNQAVVRLYKRASLKPVDTEARPNRNLTYTFQTSALSPADSGGKFNGWSKDIPESDSNKNPCWFISAIASGTGLTDTIFTTDWNSPLKLMNDGVGITKIEEEYRLSTSSDELVPDDTPTPSIARYIWSTTQPEYVYGEHYWVRQHIFYDNGSNKYSTPVCDKSINGAINHVETHYLSTADFSVEKDKIQSRVAKTQLELIGQTYALCQTASTTSTKEAIITPQDQSWTLQTGTEITVQFEYRNTTDNPKLSINGQPQNGASLKDKDGNTLTEEKLHWEAGSIFLFKYDGTNWRLQDNLKFERLDNDETIINQTANNVLIKATKNDTTSAQGGQHIIESLINVAPEGVQISAEKVNIAGATIFNSYATKTYADGKASTAETNAKTYADGKADTAESNAKTYADGKADTAESNAKTYASQQASNAEQSAKDYAKEYTDDITEDMATTSDIPTNISQLTNDEGYQTYNDVNSAISTATEDMATIDDIPTNISQLNNDSNYATESQIPTNISQLNNDSNYTTSSYISDNYSSKSEAVSRQQRIYCRFTSLQSNLSGLTTWLTTSGSGYGYTGNTANWSLSAPQLLNSTTKYEYLYTCLQTQTVSQYNGGQGTLCSCSEPVLDNSINGLQTSGDVSSAITTNNQNVIVPLQENAIQRQQTLYLRTQTNTPTPTISNIWISSSGSGYGVGEWTLLIPGLSYNNINYPFLWEVTQTQTFSQYNGGQGTTCTNSNIILDDSDSQLTSQLADTINNSIGDLSNQISEDYSLKVNTVVRSQRIYYQQEYTDQSLPTPPDPPGNEVPTDWVTEQSEIPNTWTVRRLRYSREYPYTWCCEQSEYDNGDIRYTDVALDDSTTVIDGGHIITNSITAEQLSANSVTTEKLDANSVTANKLSIQDYITFDVIPTPITSDSPPTFISDAFGSYNEVTDSYIKLDQEPSDWQTNWKNYYTYENVIPYMILGQKGVADKFAITMNDKQIAFWEDQEKVAYITGRMMSIPKSVMLKEMNIGQQKWSWREHSSNLELKWIGDV